MPGTEQYKHAREYGTLNESDWKRFNYWKPVFVPHRLTSEILLAKQQQLIREFYLRPQTPLPATAIRLEQLLQYEAVGTSRGRLASLPVAATWASRSPRVANRLK